MQPNTDTTRLITETARNQFDSTFQMLTTLVEVCRDDTWYEYYNGVPFWYQVYHISFFIDYWFRDSYDDGEFRSMIFDERIKPEFEEEITPDLKISRDEMMQYLKLIHQKTERIFEQINDTRVAEPISKGQEKQSAGEAVITYTDVILCQIRHIMYNIGYLNGILRSKGEAESDWYAYNEDEQ